MNGWINRWTEILDGYVDERVDRLVSCGWEVTGGQLSDGQMSWLMVHNRMHKAIDAA